MTLKSSMHIVSNLLRNHWWKLSRCRSEIINGTRFTTNVEIVSVYGSQLTQKSLMNTKSLSTKKSSTQHDFTVYTEIINAYGSQLTSQSLTKTKSLLTQKSSTQHDFTADVEIVNTHNHTFKALNFIMLNHQHNLLINAHYTRMSFPHHV